MFDRFGELTIEEINQMAEGFRTEGDKESLFALAQENGIDREDAEDFLEEYVPELATPYLAAMARVEVWRREIGKGEQGKAMALGLICDMIQTMLTEPGIPEAVMGKETHPGKIYEAMKEEAGKHKSGGMAMVCGTDKQLKDLIRAYYRKEDLKGAIRKLFGGSV